MRNEYLPYLPIRSEKSAKMLEKEAVWSVLKFIRKSGFEGKTVKEISQKLGEPISTVYGAIDSLENEGYIRGIKPSKLKKWGRPSKTEAQKGKAAKKYFEACELRAGLAQRKEGEKESPWGDVVFSDEFYNEIGRIIQKHPDLKEITERLIKLVGKLGKESIPAKLNSKGKKFLPSAEKCMDCNCSHEGFEFLKAITLYIATESLNSEGFKTLMKELDYKA